MRIILFEDKKTARLSPASLTRPVAMISCGGYRLNDLVQSLGLPVLHAPRPHLSGSVPTAGSGVRADLASEGQELQLLLNGRLVPVHATLEYLQQWVREPEPGMLFDQDTLLAALVPKDALNQWDFSAETLHESLARGSFDRREFPLPTFEYPHQIIQFHLEFLAENLLHKTQNHQYEQTKPGLFLGPGASIDSSATIDTSAGVIVLERGATLGPHAHVRGPVLLGAESVVLPHATIGTHTASENNCKIGGEVSCSIISAYSNKAHFGFLGHSFLGSWVNLGAGTTNSNLKTTYGEINMQHDDRRIATGMQFLGCLIGDHTKTAIGTNIFTGKTIGAYSMLYGTIAENVPSFVNYAKQFGKMTSVSPNVAADVHSRMLARRGIEQTDADRALLTALYTLTQSDREHFAGALPEEPLVL